MTAGVGVGTGAPGPHEACDRELLGSHICSCELLAQSFHAINVGLVSTALNVTQKGTRREMAVARRARVGTQKHQSGEEERGRRGGGDRTGRNDSCSQVTVEAEAKQRGIVTSLAAEERGLCLRQEGGTE